MTNLFADISLILATTTIFAAIFARFRQPIVLSYLLVGILAASGGFLKEAALGNLIFFAELGIAFALFLVGLEMRFSDIKQIGRTSTIVGFGQIILTTIFGLILAKTLHFDLKESLILSFGIAFSSTIIVVRLLTEKRDLDSLYGKISTGYLIIQDFVAIAGLIFLAAYNKGNIGANFLLTLIQGLAIILLILFLNRFVLQKLFDIFAKDSEVLFLAGISWALVFSSLSVSLGFSIEIGAFLAGLGLANLREQYQIAAWVKPLRDLFIAIFFLSLGLQLPMSTFLSVLGPVVLFSLFVLIGKPLIMMALVGVLGFRRRTSFHIALTSTQVSEFSLIFVALGNKVGLIGERVAIIVAATALTTIIFSTYVIKNSSKIYKVLSIYLKIFERSKLIEQVTVSGAEFTQHTILIGAGRLGWNILNKLINKNVRLVVVEFNPKIVKMLQDKNIPVIYGDISDPEIFEKALGKDPQMIISTVFDQEDTRALLTEVKIRSLKIPVVVTAPQAGQALEYYKSGAAYVIIPRILSSHLVERLLFNNQADLIQGGLRREHMEELKELDASF